MGAVWLVVLLLLGAMLTACILAVTWDKGDTHETRVAQVCRTHQETMHLLDKTADYYARLYEYIDKRLDDEFRRRQSDPSS